MRFRNIFITLGFITLALQFLGFPQSWDNAFYIAIGLLVIAFGYLSGKETRRPVSDTQAQASVAPLQA